MANRCPASPSEKAPSAGKVIYKDRLTLFVCVNNDRTFLPSLLARGDLHSGFNLIMFSKRHL